MRTPLISRDQWVTDRQTGRLVVILSCGGKKLDQAAPASKMYTGHYFRTYYDYAASLNARILIFSAKHGLIPETEVIEPYEVTFREPEKYADQFVPFITMRHPVQQLRESTRGTRLVCLGGKLYLRRLSIASTGLFDEVVNPSAALTKQLYPNAKMGYQGMLLSKYRGRMLPYHVGENHD